MPLSQLEALIRSGQYGKAMRVFLEVLKHENLKRKDLALAYHCASIARYHTEEWYSALEFGRLAEDNAIAAGDSVLLGRIWINMIGFHRQIGDTSMAAETGEKWLSNLGMYPELADQECRVHYNLALVYRSRHDNQQSFRHYESAIESMSRDSAPQAFKVMVHQMFAWTLYEADQVDKADAQVVSADALIQEDDQEALREQLLLKCLRAYQTGDNRMVCSVAEEFLMPGMPATLVQSFWATWMLGMVAARLGQLASARAMALLAKDFAVRTKTSAFINRVCELDRVIQSIQSRTAQRE